MVNVNEIEEGEIEDGEIEEDITINKKRFIYTLTKNDKKLLDQIEFYFSDANLHRDVWLRNKIKKKGFPLKKLLQFNRVKKLLFDEKQKLERLNNVLAHSVVLVVKDNRIDRREKFVHRGWRDSSTHSLIIDGLHRRSTIKDVQNELYWFIYDNRMESRDLKWKRKDFLYITMRKTKGREKTFFRGSIFLELPSKAHCDDFIEVFGDRFKKKKPKFRKVEWVRKWRPRILRPMQAHKKIRLSEITGANMIALNKEKAFHPGKAMYSNPRQYLRELGKSNVQRKRETQERTKELNRRIDQMFKKNRIGTSKIHEEKSTFQKRPEPMDLSGFHRRDVNGRGEAIGRSKKPRRRRLLLEKASRG